MTEYWKRAYLLHSKSRQYKRRIQNACDVALRFVSSCNAPYLSFSGGKDSTVLLWVFKQIGRTDIPVVTQSDDMDWPWKEEHCHRVIETLGFSDYSYLRTDQSVWQQVAEGRDLIDIGRLFYKLLDDFAEDRNRTGFCMGIRAEESKGRRITINRAAKSGYVCPVKADGYLRGYPLGRLTGMDVMACIMQDNLPYAHVYDHHGDQAPHKIRFSWFANPEFFHLGQAVWLKQEFPEMYNRFAAAYPAIRQYV